EEGLVFFFFQAEDGIRDRNVTGVQTCALPISCRLGLLRLCQGDAVGAEEAFRLAVASGHAEAAAEAATWLGGLLARRGHPEAGQIGRASCRERVSVSGGGAALKADRVSTRWQR